MASDWFVMPMHVGGYAAGGLLLLAMLPPETLGAGYFDFLRWAVFVVSCFWIAYGIKFPKNIVLIIGSSAAILWNPIFPLYLGRELWFWLDLLFGLLFLIFANGLVPLLEEGKPDVRKNWEV